MTAAICRWSVERTWRDGMTHVVEDECTWDGWTAEDAHRARLRRLRDAGADVTTDGRTITVRRQFDEWSDVERIFFTDEADR